MAGEGISGRGRSKGAQVGLNGCASRCRVSDIDRFASACAICVCLRASRRGISTSIAGAPGCLGPCKCNAKLSRRVQLVDQKRVPNVIADRMLCVQPCQPLSSRVHIIVGALALESPS
eukprot:917386-Prymnesium_polylepis.1